MRNKLLFALAMVGLAAGLVAAYLMGEQHRPAPPLFAPAANPFSAGLYANGIIESRQDAGQNTSLYPEVGATVRAVRVREGAQVKAGDVVLELDDSVQSATTEQLRLQAEAAGSTLAMLKAQPRPEQLEVFRAQLDLARANLRTLDAQYRKLARAYAADAGAVSREALDTAANQARAARANVDVAQRQYALTRAGAWRYDIEAQERQFRALTHAYESARALLGKYALTAPMDGTVLAINAGPGAYVSPQGVYSPYTGAQAPAATMTARQDELAVRCYIDEVLIHRLPAGKTMRAQMSVRGTDLRVPLAFDHVQPFVIPKLQLSDQRQERVDLRVLPVVFRFRPPAGARLYPGQLVDVYIATAAPAGAPGPGKGTR